MYLKKSCLTTRQQVKTYFVQSEKEQEMAKEPLSQIEETIKGHNSFLTELAEQAGADDYIAECVTKLDQLNREGQYESFMRDKWSDLRWWMAAAINYNNMTLDRISKGRFSLNQLAKIESNTLTKSKRPKAKVDVVKMLGALCQRE